MENKKDEKKVNQEFESLNSVFDEFSLQELEERLETDPLAVGGLIDLNSTLSTEGTDGCNFCFACNNKG